tara:strand:- start:391 stop:1047 length:657 start_codon:yes stop_codon:yes gene_type:complete
MDTIQFNDLLQYENCNSRFKPLHLKDNLKLSIQAGRSLYSNPRKDGLNINDYTEFEVALVQDSKLIDPKLFHSKVRDFINNENISRDGLILPYMEKRNVQKLYEILIAITSEQRLDRMIERILREDILTNCSYLVSDCLNERTIEEIRDNEYSILLDEDDYFREPMEYWFVTSWLAVKLDAWEECVTQIGNNHVWSRTTTGQSISLDYVIIQIAKSLI